MIILPEQAQQATTKFLSDNYNHRKSVAILLDILYHSELGLLCHKRLNEYLKTHPFDDVFMYALNRDLSPITPNFAIYSPLELAHYTGTVVATDLPTWNAARSSTAVSKWFYVYDVNRFNKADPRLIAELNKGDFQIFTRTKEHKKFLNALGINVLDKYLPDINITQMMEIIHG